ncbi:MAG: GIY-YIG nuclease family protein [Burkholderiaceae bacterium]|nr:GIY-YIG nuclease family protein [Burkholderiaceae bacterium]
MHQPFPQQPACYQIRNTITNERYVGATKNLADRVYAHFRALRNGLCPSKRFQASYDEHGEDAFVVEVIEYTNDPFTRELQEFVLAFTRGEQLLDATSETRARRWLSSPLATFDVKVVSRLYKSHGWTWAHAARSLTL